MKENAAERWTRIQALFGKASELPETERVPFVTRETSDDLTLRQELLGLLACDTGHAISPLTRAIGAAFDSTTRHRRAARLGQIFGNYRIVSVLGQGGTGTVYLAERADRKYSAQVAVKVVESAAMLGDLDIRFTAERQILATLNHPNIARLIDAGETTDSHPYIVMEYVHGEPVDRYCDRAMLDIRARLELFLEICAAVQYAHQNLVIHRDLKPANVLVTEEGVPKLLDFGIAKLLNVGTDTAAMLALTRMNDRLLTPEYASPEQILGHPVTTASDVYALGVVLYELLTGMRPYIVPGSASQLELERLICVTDSHRPSTAIRRALDIGPVEGQSSIQAIATVRGLTPDRLQRHLHGDIDAIIMRALRKEPQHRYGSVDQLAADIRRHLSNEPVQARQGNWVYYTQRFTRRHLVGVSAIVVVMLLILTNIVSLSIKNQTIAAERDRALQDRRRAETVSGFMLSVFEAADPFVNVGKEPTARNLLEQASRRIQSNVDLQPDVRSRLLEAIGRAFRRMGFPDRAIPHLQDSLRLQHELTAGDYARTGSVLTELAIALREAGQFEESDRTFAQALEVSQRSKGTRSEDYAQLLADLGRLEILRASTQNGRQHLSDALSLMRALRGPNDPEVGAILLDLATIAMWAGDFNEAERMAKRAVQIYASVPEFHPDRITATYRLGEVLYLKDHLTEAAAAFEQVLNAQRLLYGINGTVVDTLGSLAQVRRKQGNLPEAERLLLEALAAYQELGNVSGHKLGYLQTVLARVWMGQSKFAQAEAILREALDVFAKSLPPDHDYVASAEHYLGEALLALGKLSDAEAVLTAATNRWKRTDAAPWWSARSANSLGQVLYREGRITDAEHYLVSSLRDLYADPGADQDAKSLAKQRISRFYTDRGQRDKLDILLKEIESSVTSSALPER